MKPKVSVIIPVYNGARFISCALDSVIIQDVPSEIIVIDDNSSDNIEEVLTPYLQRSEIRLLKNNVNVGAAESRNRGVRAAQGEYVAFLDCDDWWEPDKLKKQLALMKKSGCVLCSTGRRLVTPDGRKTKRIICVKQTLSYNSMLVQNPINCSSVLLKRDVALEFPMSHDEYHEDYITWLRILRKYRRACAIDEPLLNYRISSSGKSGNKLQSAGMTFHVYRCMGFSWPKSIVCFIAYTLNGVRKYARW